MLFEFEVIEGSQCSGADGEDETEEEGTDCTGTDDDVATAGDTDNADDEETDE